MFPSPSPVEPMVEPAMEAAGIEPAQDSPGTIYAIQAVHGGPVKIGWTNSTESVAGRLRSLQTGHPYPLTVIWTKEGSRAEEIELHRDFKCWKLSGEWFDAAGDVATFFALDVHAQPLGEVYDKAWDAGWQRGYDDANWELEDKRPVSSSDKADEHDFAERLWILTGSAWALRRMHGKKAA